MLINQIVENRSDILKPGTRDDGQRLFLEEPMPLLQRWNVDAVAYRPSLHDENSCSVMCHYDSLEHGEKSANAFYNSDEWSKDLPGFILPLIESYVDAVFTVDDATVPGVAKGKKPSPSNQESDLLYKYRQK